MAMLIDTRPKKLGERVQLDKWYFWIGVRQSYNRVDPLGWRVFEIGLRKVIFYPEEGMALGKKNEKGFRWGFSYWLPFDRQY